MKTPIRILSNLYAKAQRKPAYYLLLLLTISSCIQNKTTVSVINNNTSHDFTIVFNSRDKHLIESKTDKTVSTNTDAGTNLAFPFTTDRVLLQLDNNVTLVFYEENKEKEENNIFNEYSWNYLSNSKYHTKATYTFTNDILSKMEAIETN